MPSEKSLRPRSTGEEITAALKRAVKVMRGASRTLTKGNIAKQASLYIPESKSTLIRVLNAMDDKEFAILLEAEAVVGEKSPPIPSRSTQPIRIGDWNQYRRKSHYEH